MLNISSCISWPCLFYGARGLGLSSYCAILCLHDKTLLLGRCCTTALHLWAQRQTVHPCSAHGASSAGVRSPRIPSFYSLPFLHFSLASELDLFFTGSLGSGSCSLVMTVLSSSSSSCSSSSSFSSFPPWPSHTEPQM